MWRMISFGSEARATGPEQCMSSHKSKKKIYIYIVTRESSTHLCKMSHVINLIVSITNNYA